jgi:nicotinamidase-related amidase
MLPSLLITQCLQNDFVQAIGRFDPTPNRLHVGHDEARRLMGENPQGNVAHVIHWACALPDERLRLIHIRDWHDPSDPAQRRHLEQFDPHCIAGTPGAEFAFPAPDGSSGPAKDVPIVDSLTLNDFEGTRLSEILRPYAGEPVRVGLMGVWTEAKITFLAYELSTRYPRFEIAVCSALTASSSRAHHFQALEQLDRILGVRCIPSVGEFLAYLAGSAATLPVHRFVSDHPLIECEPALGDTEATLVRYLFRDCRKVALSTLAGGYSGNLVFA